MMAKSGKMTGVMRAESSNLENPVYVSLFSGAGIGCHGLDMAGFRCIASVEILARRLAIQSFNKRAEKEAFVCGDLSAPLIMDRVCDIVREHGGVDVIIATPPCQGMSVFNHKKKNESRRNSLVVAAIEAVQRMSPKMFIFENVARFFKTECDVSDKRMSIGNAIESLLGEQYHVFFKVINLKNFGCPSSRTRALAVGVDKRERFAPLEVFPDWEREKTLQEVIGCLPRLAKMGEIDPGDIYHSFKPYEKRMRPWIAGLREGRSAFDRKSPARRPHRIIKGRRVENKNGNGDKYRRQSWNAVPPCVHTRSDILASQNTVHPRDDRVFSIREIMRMLGVPDNFRWTECPPPEMFEWSPQQKREFLRQNEANIRQCLGEAVPPAVVFGIAQKARRYLTNSRKSRRAIMSAHTAAEMIVHIKERRRGNNVGDLMHAVEKCNERKETYAAYYTPATTAFKTMEMLPAFTGNKRLRVLEPSVGAGQLLRFLPLVLSGYEHVTIDAMDVDEEVLGLARKLTAHYPIPDNVEINFIRGDFLSHPFGEARYDIIIGNPPFRKMTSQEAGGYPRALRRDAGTDNTFAFFAARALELARHVVFICPKSMLGAPLYERLRTLINNRHAVRHICDFGETGFEGVKIETLAMAIESGRNQNAHERVLVESIPRNIKARPYARDIFSRDLPCWVIYRDEKFDKVLSEMELGVFSSFRDRQITKRHTRAKGDIRVIKSRNIGELKIISTDRDVYIAPDPRLTVQRYLNRENVFLVPNLSYSPRACYLPADSVPDGSAAVFYPNDKGFRITDDDLAFFASDDFHAFYRVARNYGTRTLNIDAISTAFFGVRRC